MTELPLRRVAIFLLAYAALAWVVLLIAAWLRPLLALPPLFDTLLRALLIIGVPVVILLAVRYPQLGVTDDDR